MKNMEIIRQNSKTTQVAERRIKSAENENEMKTSIVTKTWPVRHLALSLLAGAALVVASPKAPAENAHGRSSAGDSPTKVAAVNFQETARSGVRTFPVSGAFAYGCGLLLAALLMRVHARAVLKKSART